MSRIISMSHHIPRPPRVNNFPTAAPTCPRQNRSMPTSPSSIAYNRVVRKKWLVYLIQGIPSFLKVLLPKHSMPGKAVQFVDVNSTSWYFWPPILEHLLSGFSQVTKSAGNKAHDIRGE